MKHSLSRPRRTRKPLKGDRSPGISGNPPHAPALLPRAVSVAVSLWAVALPGHAQPSLPTDPTVVHGNATIHTVGDHMTVTNSPNAILNWQDFSIGNNQQVYFQQPDATSQVLNRVIGNDPSHILGHLGSNGGVWLINPNGILFGQNAQVNVAGLVASTLDISNIDFLAGRYNFVAGGTNPGQVTNQGEVRTTFGGRVLLVGEQVQNEGTVQTPGGSIVLAAGKSLELIDSGAPNVVVRVSAPESRVANLGSLVAESGGNIDLHGSIVNQEGIVRASSLGTDSAGRIVLKASEELKLAESSLTQANGGNVTMEAGTSTALAGLVDVSRQAGTGGSIQLNTGKLDTVVGSALNASGEQGGHIRIEGTGLIDLSSSVSASGTSKGGMIEVTSDQVYLRNASLHASGGTQGGIVHIGGGWQGSGDLPHARQVLIGRASEVKANGAAGSTAVKGGVGEIAIWSTQSSQFYGLLQARDGGRIELSSRGTIDPQGNIQAGTGGIVLFDPKNLFVDNNTPVINISEATFTSRSSEDSHISPSTIQTQLSSGTPVTLQANNNISVNTDISVVTPSGVPSGGNLTLQAGHSIGFNSLISTDRGNLTAVAGYTGTTPADIAAISANRDPGIPTITISPGISVDVGTGTAHLEAVNGNVTLGSGGTLDAASAVLQAMNGNLTLDTKATLFVRDSAVLEAVNGNLTINLDASVRVTAGDAILAAVNGNFINNNGEAAIQIVEGRWLIYASDPRTSTEGFPKFDSVGNPLYGWRYNQPFIAGSTPPSAQNGDNWFFYSIAPFVNVSAEPRNIRYGSNPFGGAANYSGFIDGDTEATRGAVSGTPVWAVVGPNSSGGHAIVGSHDLQYADGLTSDLGYQFVDNTSISNELTVTPFHVFVDNPAAANKVYDSTRVATLTGGTIASAEVPPSGIVLPLPQGDSVSVSGATAIFDSKDVGIDKAVTLSGTSLSGADAGNYVVTVVPPPSGIPTTTADITQATLTGSITAADKPYDATTAATITSRTLSGVLGNDVVNYVGGTANFSDPNVGIGKTVTARGLSLAGTDAGNYTVNSTATTLAAIFSDPGAEPPTILVTITQRAADGALNSLERVEPLPDCPTSDGVSTVPPHYRRFDWSNTSWADKVQEVESRKVYKDSAFAFGMCELRKNPKLAETPPCKTLAEIDSGLCKITQSLINEYESKQIQVEAQETKMAVEEKQQKRELKILAGLPQIEQKRAVLFGIDQYGDPGIPQLESAVYDAETVGSLLSEKLGYNATVKKNATKADILRALNQLALEMGPSHSLTIYFAGHGFLDDKTGLGYWVPTDGSSSDPAKWLSNTEISEQLSLIRANQVFMIADSCYSGAFTREQQVSLTGGKVNPDEILAKRTVIAMSSGMLEVVSDEGKDGHSIFAWYLIEALRNIDTWEPGTHLFQQVQREVRKDFPQTPQYGGIKSAGNQAGTDYLIERRQLQDK
jgi:filamentous hemagglutinin family protein